MNMLLVSNKCPRETLAELETRDPELFTEIVHRAFPKAIIKKIEKKITIFL